MPVDVPAAFAASYGTNGGASGRAWIAALPGLAADFLDRWALRLDGPAAHGMASLVLPVTRADGMPAVLKLQQVTEDNIGAAPGLRVWDGDGVVRLLDHDPDTGTMLLERLDAARPLSTLADDTAAVQILAELMARLVAVAAPPGFRQLADIAAAMLDAAPDAVPLLRDPAERRLVDTCASAVAGLLPSRATGCCTGTCTTTTSSPDSANRGWPSTPNPWRATPGSSCCPRWTTAGPRWWRAAT